MHVATRRRSNSASQSPSSHSQQQSTQQTTFSSPPSTTLPPNKKDSNPASPGHHSRSSLTVLVNQAQQSSSKAEEELSGNQIPTSSSPSTHQQQSSPLSSLASSSNPNLLNNNNKAGGQLGSSSAGSSNAGSSTQTRNRRVFNFTTSAFGVLRFRRLALNNPRLLRKYGITTVQIRDICNGEASQNFDLPKRCPPSPTQVTQDSNPNRPNKYKSVPKATQFVPISQNLLRASTSQQQSSAARSNSKLIAGTSVQPPQKVNSSLNMEQRTATVPPQSQLNRLASGPSTQQMQEPGSVTESPLLMNLLSSNNNNGQMGAGNGMSGQQVPPHQMNPAMMRYPNQQQQLQSPMYAPGAQQSPQYMQQGRIPAVNMQGHPMIMPQSMGTVMPGQHPQQMPPPVAQAPEQPVSKKRKRQTKKQKEEESKKQAQAQQAQTPTQMHPNMMPHQPQQIPQQMHPDFYMMQQAGQQQQRVPPVNMHMAPSQMQQYRAISYPGYGQHPPQYGQPSASMMGTPPQYPGQQHYAQWNPNMPQHHMAQQSADYHMQMQRGQIPPQQQTGPTPGTPVHHYPQPQPSPASDMKNRIPPPSYNDSMQQQFVQQQRQTPSFMSPPANQQQQPNQGPGSNYSMQQQPTQQMSMHQSAAHHYAQQLQHRVMSDISDNMDELMATIGGGDSAEDFDLDSIELEPMRTDGGEIPGTTQQPQSVPTPQQSHPGPSPHYYQPQSIPSAYGNMVSYGSPSSQQFANQQQSQQNYQMHPNMMAHQQMPHQQQIPAQAPPSNPTPQPTREQQVANQKSMEKSREQQQKLEQKQLEIAMSRSPGIPHSPSNVEVPLHQQQRVATAIDSVMEKILTGKSFDDPGASTSQPTPPPNKRKKASTAKAQTAAQLRAQPQAQQVPVQAMPPQQPQAGQFNQMPIGMYGNGQYAPGTPTFANSQQQQQYYFRMQQQQQQQMMRQMNYQGPSTPLSAPPVSTPDQQYFYGQQGMPQENAPNGANRAINFKNIMPRNETSNPHTPQTPNQQQPTPQQISQKMFENGGGSSATSSAAATPSSSSQHRMSIDEQSGNQFIGREEQFGGNEYNQQYAQYNGHSNQHFMFNQQQQVENATGTANEIKMQVSGAVSLKSQIGELGNNPSTELCTPPSANAGISSATPTTASQLNHVETEPLKVPKNEPVPQIDAPPLNIKNELKNSCEKLKEELLSSNQDAEERTFNNDLPPKNELNGPTSNPSTSTVAE